MVFDPLTRFFHPVACADDVRPGPYAAQVGGERFAVFRDRSGRAGVLPEACPHRLAPLTAGEVLDGRLSCPYHGWNFDVQGAGRSPSQPTLARCDTTALSVVEAGGLIFAATDAGATRPRLSFDGYTFAGAFHVPFAAPLHVCLDNFSEDEHTPWVHTRLGWDRRDVGAVTFSARNFEDRTEVSYAGPQRPSVLARPFGVKPGDIFHNSWVTTFDPVCTVYSIHWASPKGERRPLSFRAAIYMTPRDERHTDFFVASFLRVGAGVPGVAAPVLRRLAVALAHKEILDDARFIPLVADTPATMDGMRLGKYDKPLIHNRKLLARRYFSRPEVP